MCMAVCWKRIVCLLICVNAYAGVTAAAVAWLLLLRVRPFVRMCVRVTWCICVDLFDMCLRLVLRRTAALKMAVWAFVLSLQSKRFPTARPARQNQSQPTLGSKLSSIGLRDERRGREEGEWPGGERPRGLFLSLVQCDETGRQPIRHDEEPTRE